VRGYSIMKGYWGDEARTAEAVVDGWGDLATIDADGYCNIVGRVKDMLIRGGENIYPREIEEFLFRHEKVQSVQVFGVPDAKYGEEVCAWIVLKPGAQATAEEIGDFCRDQIAHYMVPRHISFVTEMRMTVTGKVQKFVMRERTMEEMKLSSQRPHELTAAVAAVDRRPGSIVCLWPSWISIHDGQVRTLGRAARSLPPVQGRARPGPPGHHFCWRAQDQGCGGVKTRWQPECRAPLVAVQPRHRRADPTAAEPARMRGKREVLTGAATVEGRFRVALAGAEEHQHRRTPEDLEVRSPGPAPGLASGLVFGGIAPGLRPIAGQTLLPLDHHQGPRAVVAHWRHWHLHGVPEQVFEHFARHRLRRERAHRTAAVDCIDEVHGGLQS
jgi:hypothetical protein